MHGSFESSFLSPDLQASLAKEAFTAQAAAAVKMMKFSSFIGHRSFSDA
jgi:hypothetical protein